MPSSFSAELRAQLEACAYPGYVYGYPHKKAYRPLPPVSVVDAWRDEERSRLFAYVHLPFCNQRCSFCNLFTLVPADRSVIRPYLDALTRQMDVYARLIPSGFSRLYIGGGTPTYLEAAELRRLFGDLRRLLGVDPCRTQGCIEASPDTLDAEKVETLAELGIQRLSLGVQSFDLDELQAVNRRFDFIAHREAIDLIARAGFPRFNIDLIYGLPGQTLASWRHSLQQAIDSPANGLFLYPLYIRPLTGLARRSSLDAPTTHQIASMYDLAVDRLRLAGFRQVTMRQFRRDKAEEADDYRCQRDGMLGLGAGARSYTTALHYSTPWRMVARNIRTVIDDYIAADHHWIVHGFRLDADEQQRRHVIQGLLYAGLAPHEADTFPGEFAALEAEGLIERGEHIKLTPRGLRHADIVGGLFFSPRVRSLIAEYEYDT